MRTGLPRGGAGSGGLLDMLEHRARMKQLSEIIAKQPANSNNGTAAPAEESKAAAAAGESGGVQWLGGDAKTESKEKEDVSKEGTGAGKKKKKNKK